MYIMYLFGVRTGYLCILEDSLEGDSDERMWFFDAEVALLGPTDR